MPRLSHTLGTTTANTATITTQEPDTVRLYTKVVELMGEVSEHDALRVFLAINHKDILEQFDAAYAARKRMGVKP